MLSDKLYTYRATILSVTDGDTIKVRVDMGMRVYRDIVLRLAEINAPEKSGVTKAAGLAAKDAVTAWLDGKKIYLRTEKDPGSYDRYTAFVYDEATGEELNNYLVDNDFAVYYTYKW